MDQRWRKIPLGSKADGNEFKTLKRNCLTLLKQQRKLKKSIKKAHKQKKRKKEEDSSSSDSSDSEQEFGSCDQSACLDQKVVSLKSITYDSKLDKNTEPIQTVEKTLETFKQSVVKGTGIVTSIVATVAESKHNKKAI